MTCSDHSWLGAIRLPTCTLIFNLLAEQHWSAISRCAWVGEKVYSSPCSQQACLGSSPSSVLSLTGCAIMMSGPLHCPRPQFLIPQIGLIISPSLLLLLLMQQDFLSVLFSKYFLMPYYARGPVLGPERKRQIGQRPVCEDLVVKWAA